MNKSDLKTGMRVTAKNGSKFIVIINCRQNYDNTDNFIVNGKSKHWEKLSNYNDDLTTRYDENSIVKVETPNHPYNIFDIDSDKFTTIWERKQPKEMTLEEIESELGYPVKIVK